MVKSFVKKNINGYLIGFIIYHSVLSAILREIMNKGLGISRPTTLAISTGIIMLTAYPLFIRHVPNKWSKNNEPIALDKWALLTLAASICMYLFALITS